MALFLPRGFGICCDCLDRNNCKCAVFPKYGALAIVPVEAVAANPKATRQEQCHPTKTWPRSLGETTMRDPGLRTQAAAPRKTGDPMQRKTFPISARAQSPQKG